MGLSFYEVLWVYLELKPITAGVLRSRKLTWKLRYSALLRCFPGHTQLLNGKDHSVRTSFLTIIFSKKSFFLNKWKMCPHMKLKHDLIRASSLISQLLWIYLVLMLPFLWLWKSSHRFWLKVQRHPSQVCLESRKSGLVSVCSLSSDQGHTDVQSPCGALPLVRNNSSISEVM